MEQGIKSSNELKNIIAVIKKIYIYVFMYLLYLVQIQIKFENISS